MMSLTPITLKQAQAFIRQHHRHCTAPHGWRFGTGLSLDGHLIGVAVVEWPRARMLHDGTTAEVTRLCTNGHPNACSKLYSACARAAKALGYTRVITYTLTSEPGTSLRAAGWELVATTRDESWHRQTRPRNSSSPTGQKHRWQKTF